MYCTKCGAEIENNARFCIKCGAEQNNTGRISKIEKKSKNIQFPFKGIAIPKKVKPIPAVIIILLLIIVLVFPKFIFSGNAHKKIVKKFVEAEFTGDVEKLMSLVPDEVWEKTRKEENMTRKEMKEELAKLLASVTEMYEESLGENWEYSYDITYTADVSGDDLEDLRDEYRDEMEIEISAAKDVEVEFVVKGEETEVSKAVNIPVIKIKGDWYLDFINVY